MRKTALIVVLAAVASIAFATPSLASVTVHDQQGALSGAALLDLQNTSSNQRATNNPSSGVGDFATGLMVGGALSHHHRTPKPEYRRHRTPTPRPAPSIFSDSSSSSYDGGGGGGSSSSYDSGGGGGGFDSGGGGGFDGGGGGGDF